jgi:hypothetical protein
MLIDILSMFNSKFNLNFRKTAVSLLDYSTTRDARCNDPRRAFFSRIARITRTRSNQDETRRREDTRDYDLVSCQHDREDRAIETARGRWTEPRGSNTGALQSPRERLVRGAVFGIRTPSTHVQYP